MCRGGLLSLPPCRSVIVENSASTTNATEILKPVKKRKRKDYQSPSEEEYESEQMVGRGQGWHVCARANVKGGPWATPVCTAGVHSSCQCFSVLCQLHVEGVACWLLTQQVNATKRVEYVEHQGF